MTRLEMFSKSKLAYEVYKTGDFQTARILLVEIYHAVRRNIDLVNGLDDYALLGKAFMLMVEQEISNNEDKNQLMASLSYLFLTQAILDNPSNKDLITDRLFLLRVGHEYLKYTLMHSLGLTASGPLFMMGMHDFTTRDTLYKMEISDLESNPTIYLKNAFFKKRKEELDDMIDRQFFMPEKTKNRVVNSGIVNHLKLYDYLSEQVFNKADLDFCF